MDIDIDKVTWAGLSTTPPLDYTSSEAPSLLTIAAVMPANLRSLYEHFLGRAVETVNNSTSMLPFTKLRFVAYTETDIITQVGTARDEAAATMLQAMIDDADTAGAPLVGILGAYSSSVSQPLAIANSRHAYPRVQCAVSTADTLSSPSTGRAWSPMHRRLSCDAHRVVVVVVVASIVPLFPSRGTTRPTPSHRRSDARGSAAQGLRYPQLGGWRQPSTGMDHRGERPVRRGGCNGVGTTWAGCKLTTAPWLTPQVL